jgi:hypothetical protein
VEAAAVLPPGTGVTGWAGMRWMGSHWLDGERADGRLLPVELCVGDSTIKRQPGFVVSEEHLRAYDLTTVDGLPITIPQRSASFLVRYAETLPEAVATLDMAAYDDLVSVSEMDRYKETLPAWTGIGMLRKAVALADENSWSPRETWLRMVWILDAELAPPWCNRPVFDRDGRLIGTPDLIDEEAGVVCEYDGALHLAGDQRRRDRDREEAFRRVGLEYLTVMRGDPPGRIATRLHEIRDRARFDAPSTRPWTLDLPPWWVPTFTVAQRRSLTEAQRARWLRHRRPA